MIIEQYISKFALVAEIKKRMQELRPTNTHKMQVGEKMDRDVLMWLNALTWVKKVIDTLEVTEVDEEYNGKAMLYVLNKGVEQGKKEMLDKACEWLENSQLLLSRRTCY